MQSPSISGVNFYVYPGAGGEGPLCVCVCVCVHTWPCTHYTQVSAPTEHHAFPSLAAVSNSVPSEPTPRSPKGGLECLVLYYFYSPGLVLGNSKCCICIMSFNLHNNLSSEYLRNFPQAAWGEGKAEVQTQVCLLLPVPLHIFSITNR